MGSKLDTQTSRAGMLDSCFNIWLRWLPANHCSKPSYSVHIALIPGTNFDCLLAVQKVEVLKLEGSQ